MTIPFSLAAIKAMKRVWAACLDELAIVSGYLPIKDPVFSELMNKL